MDILKLKELIQHHDDLYYNQDDPEITDAEYDVLKRKLIHLTGEVDNTVPGEALFNKYEHSTPILSLDKVQIIDTEKLREEIERLWPIVIEPKFDGLTIVAYRGPKFVTRGNGYIGEDVTEKCLQIEGLDKINPFPSPLRMEVVMPISEFNRINEDRKEQGLVPFKNARNAAAGMLRNKDKNKVQGLKAYIYDIVGHNESTHSSTLYEFSAQSFEHELCETTPFWEFSKYQVSGRRTIEDAIEFIKNFDRTKLDYEIDGLVIKSNIANSLNHFGTTGHHPKDAIAVKFEAEGGWTFINKIVWQVGRTGKITPVAEFDPIDILGSTVTRATLHNMGIIESLGLDYIMHKGKYRNSLTKINVIKANDVIPAVVGVKQPSMDTKDVYTEKIDEPVICPKCHGEVEKINDQLFCRNNSCPAKVLGRLVHMAQRDAFNIEGLSEETAKKMIDLYMEQLNTMICEPEKFGLTDKEVDMAYEEAENLHPSFIYSLTVDDILCLEGFAEKSAQKLYDNIQKSLNIDFDKFLYGCGIPLVGRRMSRDIAYHYYNKYDSELEMLLKDYDSEFAFLENMNGIGEETIKSLKDNFMAMIDPFGRYEFNIKDIKPNIKAVAQMNIVITGKFDTPRNDIKKMIEVKGHKVASSVSAKTSILLASPGEESTTKYKKATELGIQIVNSIGELEELL